MTHARSLALLSALALSSLSCTDSPEDHDHDHDTPTAFSLKFAAAAGGQVVGCTDTLTGLGPAGEHSVGISDLRFYISNLRFYDAAGAEVEVTLDTNEFQYRSDAGEVALIDLTGTGEGSCADSAIAFAEGTARVHDVITGTTHVDDVASVSFDVGVPQALMKETIANNTAEGAPSPLAEMYWSWASGYRHFVFNFTIDAAGEPGEGYIHIGSGDCGAPGELALEGRDACGRINTPTVTLDGFDLTADTVLLDIPAVLADLDFLVTILDPDTMEPIGEGPGVACHSGPSQPDCPPVFSAFSLDVTSGSTLAPAGVFTVM
ncbi:MAG: metallo-mystery pair system four-Cys motif protein [Nannocystaceae bacterium]|nr:metallo-mystery pair system four-Cys motif protein [Myxococcales bacterium]